MRRTEFSSEITSESSEIMAKLKIFKKNEEGKQEKTKCADNMMH